MTLLAGMLGPTMLTAYVMMNNFVQLFYPGQNVILVMWTWAHRGSGMVYDIYPFKEIKHLFFFFKEMYYWITEVGKCGMMKIYNDYIAMYVDKDYDPSKVISYERCCMAEQVGKIRATVEKEVTKREEERLKLAAKEKGEKDAAAAAEGQKQALAQERLDAEHYDADYSKISDDLETNITERMSLEAKITDLENDPARQDELAKEQEKLNAVNTKIETLEQNLALTQDKMMAPTRSFLTSKLKSVKDIFDSCSHGYSGCEEAMKYEIRYSDKPRFYEQLDKFYLKGTNYKAADLERDFPDEFEDFKNEIKEFKLC